MEKTEELKTKKQELEKRRNELYQKTLKSDNFELRKEYEKCEDEFRVVSEELAELEYQEKNKKEVKKSTERIEFLKKDFVCPACGGKNGEHFECALDL